MKETYVARINKIGKIGCVISTVATALTALGVCRSIIMFFALSFIPKNGAAITGQTQATMVYDTANNSSNAVILSNNLLEGATFRFNGTEYFDMTVEDNIGNIVVTGTSKPVRIDLRQSAWIFIALAIIGFVCMQLFSHINTLFQNFKTCETPFNIPASDSINKIAWYLVALSLVRMATQSVFDSFSEGKISITFNIDITTVLILLMVFILSYIFRYGRMLQQESDETL